MTEQEQDERKLVERGLLLAAPDPEGDAAHKGGRKAGLIFDLSDTAYFNLASLSMLLTARLMARRANRDVWLAGLPAQGWMILKAMGLARYFKAFPGAEGVEA